MTRVILLRLGDHLEIGKASRDSPRKLGAFGNLYDEVVLGRDGFLGFYDWLRTSKGDVVGSRLSIDSARPDLGNLIPVAPYVVRETRDVLRFLFADADQIDEAASTDQDFGCSRVFRDASAQAVPSFDAESLTPEEFDGLDGDRSSVIMR